jgi:hypothetical protein
LLSEWNDWPPKYSSTTPPTISAMEIALVIKISSMCGRQAY